VVKRSSENFVLYTFVGAHAKRQNTRHNLEASQRGEEAAAGELRASSELAFTLLRRWYIGKEAFDYPQRRDLDCGNFARRQDGRGAGAGSTAGTSSFLFRGFEAFHRCFLCINCVDSCDKVPAGGYDLPILAHLVAIVS
jgi:hypothetical protein